MNGLDLLIVIGMFLVVWGIIGILIVSLNLLSPKPAETELVRLQNEQGCNTLLLIHAVVLAIGITIVMIGVIFKEAKVMNEKNAERQERLSIEYYKNVPLNNRVRLNQPNNRTIDDEIAAIDRQLLMLNTPKRVVTETKTEVVNDAVNEMDKVIPLADCGISKTPV